MKRGTVIARTTLSNRLEATNWRPSGFDYMRLGLAVSVVIIRGAPTTYGTNPHVVEWADVLDNVCSPIS